MPLIESAYLEELIQDFPPEQKISGEKASVMLHDRYKVLGLDFISSAIDIIQNPPSITYENEEKLSPLDILYMNGETAPLIFFEISKFIHKYLYKKILSNAGEYRKNTDPNRGFIGFGGFDRRVYGNLQFTGAVPSDIEKELFEAFSFLIKNPVDPIKSSILFYRKFVKTHPYYDGNGRIGRLIMTIYLRQFNYQINWDKIPVLKLMRKLNQCHQLENNPAEFNRHLGYLISFIKSAINLIEEDIMFDNNSES